VLRDRITACDASARHRSRLCYKGHLVSKPHPDTRTQLSAMTKVFVEACAGSL